MKLSLVLYDNLEGWDGIGVEGRSEGGHIHILMAESYCLTAESYTTL